MAVTIATLMFTFKILKSSGQNVNRNTRQCWNHIFSESRTPSDNAMAKEEQDLALNSSGCVVSYASCKHEELAPCDNILDGSRTTFWATTGLYPHNFTLTFPGPVKINGVKIRSYYVKKMVVESSNENERVDFQELKSLDLQLTDLHHQVTELEFDCISARHLRFQIKEGYEDFCAIYKVEVFGDAAQREERLAAMPVTTTVDGAGPIRTSSQISAPQLSGRPSVMSRQPQGLRTMQNMSSAGLTANGAPPSAASSRSPFQPSLGSLPSQPHTPVTPSSTADRNSNAMNSSDPFRLEEDW